MSEAVLRTMLECSQTASLASKLENSYAEKRHEDERCEYPGGQCLLSKLHLLRYMRAHVNSQLYDESGVDAEGTAIYRLADPRDLRLVRYVGQAKSPRRRFFQHLNAARLWMPDETPWWIKSPKLRPLYDWIRQLYSDGYRLPTMVVDAWVTEHPRHAERTRIEECISQQLPLLNVEANIPARKKRVR